MKLFVFILMALSIWHFVYESLVAPTIRLHLKNRLFAIRDELRKVDVQSLSHEEVRAFNFVHTGINNFINRLPNITISNMFKVQLELIRNVNKKKMLDDHVQSVLNCRNQNILTAFSNTNSVIENAFIANMGAWFIYILPIALLMGALKKMSSLLPEIVMFPSKDVDRLIPGKARPA